MSKMPLITHCAAAGRNGKSLPGVISSTTLSRRSPSCSPHWFDGVTLVVGVLVDVQPDPDIQTVIQRLRYPQRKRAAHDLAIRNAETTQLFGV